MTEPRDPSTPDPFVPERFEPLEGELVVDGYGWLAVACNVVSAISLMLIAITLIARL